MLRTILVGLDASAYTETATALAIEWGTRFGARLLGLGILDTTAIAAQEAVPLGSSIYFYRDKPEARILGAHERIQGFLSNFHSRCETAGVKAEAFEAVGDPGANILREAHRCDVVMLGRETHFRFETQQRPDGTLAEVLRGCPRPIVVAPPEMSSGDGVLVAYGGSREAGHALQIFQSLGLAGNETIHVMSVHREGSDAGAVGQLACDFLEAHGASHQFHDIQSSADPADVLLEQIKTLRPRMLVMGAHNRRPLRDLFAASVSQTVLRSSPVPVFIGG